MNGTTWILVWESAVPLIPGPGRFDPDTVRSKRLKPGVALAVDATPVTSCHEESEPA